jgi:hypothetical protein
MNFSFLVGEGRTRIRLEKSRTSQKDSGFVSATLLEGYLYRDFFIYFAATFDVGKKLKAGIYRYLAKTWNASFAYCTVAPVTYIRSVIKPQRCSEIR